MDYKKVLEECNARVEMYQKSEDAWNVWHLSHERQCATAITDLLARAEAAEARAAEFNALGMIDTGKTRARPVISIDDQGRKFIYPSIAAAAAFEGCSASRITIACRTGRKHVGYYWKYADEVSEK